MFCDDLGFDDGELFIGNDPSFKRLDCKVHARLPAAHGPLQYPIRGFNGPGDSVSCSGNLMDDANDKTSRI